MIFVLSDGPLPLPSPSPATLLFAGVGEFDILPMPLNQLVPLPYPYRGRLLVSSIIQPYDIVILAVLAGAILFGVWKGLAWQVASLASLIVSGFVAVHFSAVLAPYFSAQEPWNRFLAMFVLYIITALAIWIGFRFISGLIERVKLKEFDRQMGALFGLAKGSLLAIVITFFMVTLGESTRQFVLKSYSGDAIARITRHAVPLLPEDVRANFGKYIDDFQKKLDPNTPPETPETKGSEIADLKDLEAKGRAVGQKVEEVEKRVRKVFDP
jgi:membrane protein required for colicin V production